MVIMDLVVNPRALGTGVDDSAEKLYVVAGNRLVRARDERQAVERAGLPPAFIEGALRDVRPVEGPLFRPGWYSGCTATRHKRLGAHVGINARAGEFWRNSWGRDWTIDRRNARRELERLEEKA